MELPKDIYTWLSSIKAVTEFEVEAQDSSIVILDNEATQQFELGLKMPMILKHFYKLNVMNELKIVEGLCSIRNTRFA